MIFFYKLIGVNELLFCLCKDKASTKYYIKLMLTFSINFSTKLPTFCTIY